MNEILPSQPLRWKPEDMWAWVNELDRLLNADALKASFNLKAIEEDVGARDIYVCFERTSLIREIGYSWNNHIDDEVAYVSFGKHQVTIGVVENLPAILLARLVSIIGMLRVSDRDIDRNFTGEISFALGDGDWGRDCLAFASQASDTNLIPDPYFVLTRGYASERESIANLWTNWPDRDPRAYWRGAPSGLQKYTSHRDSQRVKLVMLAAKDEMKHLFNVKFSKIEGIDEIIQSEILNLNGVGVPEDQMEIMKYCYNVDVDGWSCAWTGFFLKLLAGSPVIKIQSDLMFRQWYYNLINPWRHFVPVSSDLHDLKSAIEVLINRPDLAEEIGRNGRSFALACTYESQIIYGANVISGAIRNKEL